MASKPCWCLVGGIFSALFFFIFLAIGIFSVGPLGNIIITKAEDGSAMSPQNYKNWGSVPGNFDINVTRRYVFQNFLNPFEVLYFNETPKFVETKSYIYQEYQNASDPVYSGNDSNGNPSIVDFNYQLYSLPLDNSTASDLVTTINLGAVGVWYSAHSLSDAEMATIGFAGLLESLDLDIPTTIQGEAIQMECVTDQANANAILSKSGIADADIQAWMWNDQVMGLSSLYTLNNWVHAIMGGAQSGAAQIIGDYFTLDSLQVKSLFSNQNLGKCVSSLNTLIQNAYSCPTDPCESKFLVRKQWSSQDITMKPAGGKIEPKPSVVYFNKTVVGFPEIAYFLTDNFTKTYPVDPTQYNISFTMDMTEWLFNKTHSEGVKWNTSPDTLLNLANLEALFAVGRAFDAQNDFNNLTILQPVVDKFKLPSLEHACVLWKYMDYIHAEFILKESLGGGRGQILMGEWASTALYLNFTTAQDYLSRDLTATLVWNNLTSHSMGCPELFNISAGIILEDATTLCKADVLSPWNVTTLKFLVEACTINNGTAYNLLQNTTGLSKMQMFNLCNPPGQPTNTFFSMLQFSQMYLKEAYNCTALYANSKKCSNYELAAKQWADSTITLNVPDLLKANFTSADSLSSWYPNLLPKPFEYRAVLKILSKNFTLYTVDPVGLDKARLLLTFDSLFGVTKVQSAFLLAQNEMWADFADTFVGLDPYQLTSYLRFIMMEIAFGGFSQTRTVQELLWGYEDPLLVFMKNRDVLKSGDPSVNTIVNLAGQNSSYEDGLNYPVSMYTGMNDSAITRQIISFYGSDNITFLNSYFNGNEVISEYVTPWAENITFQGSDGSVDHPGLSTLDNLTFYITDLSFQTNLVYNGTNNTYYGVDTYSYRLPSDALSNKTNNPNNTKYFMDKWEGFINISKLHKAPLFVCKAHFLDADTTLANAVEVYNNDMSELMSPNRSEDLHLDIEPLSGVPINVMAGFQANYQYIPDELFSYPNTAMLPIVITYRGLAFSDEQVSNVYGQLRIGLFLVNYGSWIGFGLAALFALLCVLCFLRRRKLLQPTKEQKLAEEVSLYRRMASYETKPPIELIGGNNSSEEDITPVRDTKLFKWSNDKEK